MKSTRNPVPGALAALDGALASDVFCGASSCFGSSGSFGLLSACASACGEVLFKSCASGELDPHERLMKTPHPEHDPEKWEPVFGIMFEQKARTWLTMHGHLKTNS